VLAGRWDGALAAVVTLRRMAAPALFSMNSLYQVTTGKMVDTTIQPVVAREIRALDES
jgi:hypothetical protein